LWARFVEFIREAKGCGLVEAVLVDGSFVSATPDPNDIDLVLVVTAHHDFAADLGRASIMCCRNAACGAASDLI